MVTNGEGNVFRDEGEFRPKNLNHSDLSTLQGVTSGFDWFIQIGTERPDNP